MNPRSNRIHPTFRTLACVLAASILASGCGTLLFPERKGQATGKMDPNVLVMDAALLIFWIVPGVVAYVVDFTTRAAYLPPGVNEGQGPLFGKDALFDLRAGAGQEVLVELPAPAGAGS